MAKEKAKKKKSKSVDQATIARLVANNTGFTVSEVQEIIELEQKYTMDYIKRDYKVIKKNYLILTPKVIKGRTLKNPLDGKDYVLPSRKSVSVKLGNGFKAYVSDNAKKMPNKICRFVNGDEVLNNNLEGEDIG